MNEGPNDQANSETWTRKELIQTIVRAFMTGVIFYLIFTFGNWNAHYVDETVKDYCGDLYDQYDIQVSTDITGSVVAVYTNYTGNRYTPTPGMKINYTPNGED